MDLSPYLASLRQALASTARGSGSQVQEAAELLAQSLEPALRLTLMELASDVAAEVTVQLDGDVVELRLRGGNPEVVVQQRPRTAEAPPPAPPAPPVPEDDGGTARISLRLPENLKGQVDQAAAREGVSVNTWLVRAAQQSLAGPGAQPTDNIRTGRRMSGWVR
ncbi:histidine kinase [Georgenia sp. EYE_87]|uniref:histidine kinase n=1 Tax=Georgenia sp. EYE_87 TaxID=2853448 RepID=UPI002005A66A|nr:histidine kinase [Georgenia sp. EYE_87]MCK6211150.1 histidine kinase [Georgenia sp. EYE_87]